MFTVRRKLDHQIANILALTLEAGMQEESPDYVSINDSAELLMVKIKRALSEDNVERQLLRQLEEHYVRRLTNPAGDVDAEIRRIMHDGKRN